MAKEPRSHVRKRRRGCFSGCLVNILLILGVAALLFVGAHVLGLVKNDPETGAPSLDLSGVGISGLPEIALPQIDFERLSLPSWAYGVEGAGLTVKTLRTTGGEAVLVCCDGYTMLLGSGENGLVTCAQLALCGVRELSAAIAMSLEEGQIGGMDTVVGLYKPTYLLFPDSQTKTTAYNDMIEKAQKNGATQLIAPERGLTFSLGRATVTVIGPTYEKHRDERDDGLSVRVSYGNTNVLIMGTITEAGEREIHAAGSPLAADAIICARGGSEEATGSVLVDASLPKIALMTGKNPANSVKVRLRRVGCEIYTAKEYGVMTLYSDGQTVSMKP